MISTVRVDTISFIFILDILGFKKNKLNIYLRFRFIETVLFFNLGARKKVPCLFFKPNIVLYTEWRVVGWMKQDFYFKPRNKLNLWMSHPEKAQHHLCSVLTEDALT